MAINRREFAYDLYDSELLDKKWNIGKIFIYLQKIGLISIKKRIFYLDSACVKAHPKAAGA